MCVRIRQSSLVLALILLIQSAMSAPAEPPRAIVLAAPPPVTRAALVPGSDLGSACGAYYPAASRRLNEAGSVVLLLYVNAAGRVSDVRIETSSGFPRLDEAATHCVMEQGRFIPQQVGNSPIGSWQRMKWTWKLSAPELPAELASAFPTVATATLKGDYDAATALLAPILGDAHTPEARTQALRMALHIAICKGDLPMYARYVEQLLAPGTTLSDAERIPFYRDLAEIYAQAHDYDAALQWSTQWAEASRHPIAYAYVGSIELERKDSAAAIEWLERAVAATRNPQEPLLKMLYAAFALQHDPTGERRILETLLARFPKNEYLVALAGLYAADSEPRAFVNLSRLRVERNAPTNGEEYLRYAEAALQAGAPIEATKALDEAVGRNLLAADATDSPGARLRARAQALELEERKRLRSPGRQVGDASRGDADVRAGLAYLDTGDEARAIELLERGLRPDRKAGVPRVDDAYMALGIACLRLGRRDQALEAFQQAQVDPRMEHAAALWIASASISNASALRLP
jgi:TonB family protein